MRSSAATPARWGKVPAANWVFRRVAADPLAPLTVGVVGAGGTGKTALLQELARAYETAGVEPFLVGNVRQVCAEMFDPRRAVLVDDAHRLDPAALDELRAHADSDRARLVVAYRPWPRSRSLAALGASVTRGSPTVVVGHLDRDEVAARLADRFGAPPSPGGLADLVHEQSAGLPALVDLISDDLRDSGCYDPRHPERFRRPNRVTASASSAERLRYQLEAMEPAVYRLIEAMAVGAALEPDVLDALLDARAEELVGTVEAARATGLVTGDGKLIPFIQSVVLGLMPLLRARDLHRRLADAQLGRGGSVLDVGRQLLRSSATGAGVAAVLEAAGDEALRRSPSLAAELFAGAVEAGGAPRATAARRAEALVLTGDLDQALRQVDEVAADPAAPDHAKAVSVVAAVMAHRGMPARSAQLYLGLPAGAPGGPVLAVPALVGIGALDEARAALDEPAGSSAGRPPSPLAEAETLMARGVITSVAGSPAAALSQLARAAGLLEPAGPTVLLPDTPAALTALVALHRGELSIAETALGRGITAKLGGRPAQIRSLMLFGWTAMMRGDLRFARRTLERVRPEQRLEPRDEVFAAALAVALARREDDLGTRTPAWSRARHALVCQPVDLYTLLPLGELAVAAARLGELDSITQHLEDAACLLDRLGNPPLWTVPMHWSRLHAAILADDPAEAARNAAALAAGAASSPYAGALAAAAQSWLQVLSGRVDREPTEAAARGLHRIGLAWEGARLAGQAALRAADRRAVAALQACARALQDDACAATGSSPVPDEPPAESRHPDPPGGHPEPAAPRPAAPRPAAPAPRRADGAPPDDGGPELERLVLSGRELEVSQLILAGLTYKQIGERLFISAKTVEHHVARIRGRLGVSTRNELFGRLRGQLGTAPSAGPPLAG